MSDEQKRRPSTSSRRARVDSRAEPESSSLPEPEAMVTRGRPATQPRPKPAIGINGAPRASGFPVERGTPRSVPPSETGEAVALRRQLATLQHELVETQHRLAAIQESSEAEADRMSEMLARVAELEAANREAETRLAARASGARANGDSASAEIAKLTAELEQERATSAWLRTAGEQATREVAAFRARATAREVKAVGVPADERAQPEIARLTEELQAAKEDLELALAREATSRELEQAREATRQKADEARETSAKAEVAALAAELEEMRGSLAQSGLHVVDLEHAFKVVAERGKELEAELAAAATAETERALSQGQTDAQAATRHAEALSAARAEAVSAANEERERALEELRAAHKEALNTAIAEAARALGQTRKEHEESAARLVAEHEKRALDLAKDTERHVREMASQLSTAVAALDAAKNENEARKKAVATADSRAKAAAQQLESTTGMLAVLIGLRLALSRAADAIQPRSATAPPLELTDSDMVSDDAGS